MRQFFKFVFASMVGFILTFLLFFFLLNAILVGMISKVQKGGEVSINPNSVLKMELNYEIKERTPVSPLENLGLGSFEPRTNLGLTDIIASIGKAKDNPN